MDERLDSKMAVFTKDLKSIMPLFPKEIANFIFDDFFQLFLDFIFPLFLGLF